MLNMIAAEVVDNGLVLPKNSVSLIPLKRSPIAIP